MKKMNGKALSLEDGYDERFVNGFARGIRAACTAFEKRRGINLPSRISSQFGRGVRKAAAVVLVMAAAATSGCASVPEPSITHFQQFSTVCVNLNQLPRDSARFGEEVGPGMNRAMAVESARASARVKLGGSDECPKAISNAESGVDGHAKCLLKMGSLPCVRPCTVGAVHPRMSRSQSALCTLSIPDFTTPNPLIP